MKHCLNTNTIEMKRYHIRAACLFLLTVSYNSNTQNKTATIKNVRPTTQVSPEEKIARQIFQSFKNNDEKLWEALYPDNNEYNELLQLMLKEKMAGLTQEKIDGMMKQRTMEATTVYTAEFNHLRKQADSAGIKWNKAVYSKFDYQSAAPASFSGKYLNGDLWCMYGKKEFVIEGIEAVETFTGFRLQSIKAIRKIEDSY